MPINGDQTPPDEYFAILWGALAGGVLHLMRILSDGRRVAPLVIVGRTGCAIGAAYVLGTLAAQYTALPPFVLTAVCVVGGYFGRVLFEPLARYVEGKTGMKLISEEIDAPPGPPGLPPVLSAAAATAAVPAAADSGANGAGGATVTKNAQENNDGSETNG